MLGPRFYHICNGQNTEMPVPRSFIARIPHFLDDYVILHSALGSHMIMVSYRDSQDTYYLFHGWQSFVLLHDLQQGYMVLFQFLGNHDFSVAFWDNDQSEIERLRSPYDHELPSAVARPALHAPDYNNTNFTIRFSSNPSYNWRCPRVPTRFVQANHLWGVSQIIVQNAAGAVWTIQLIHSGSRIRLGDGWEFFAESVALQDGEAVVFALIYTASLYTTLRVSSRAHFTQARFRRPRA